MAVVPREAPTRFDYVLGGMGLSLVCGVAVGVVSAVPLSTASGASSLLAALVLCVGTISEL